MQMPFKGLQESVVLEFPSSQFIGVDEQDPDPSQLSLTVHKLLSVQAVPKSEFE